MQAFRRHVRALTGHNESVKMRHVSASMGLNRLIISLGDSHRDSQRGGRSAHFRQRPRSKSPFPQERNRSTSRNRHNNDSRHNKSANALALCHPPSASFCSVLACQWSSRIFTHDRYNILSDILIEFEVNLGIIIEKYAKT